MVIATTLVLNGPSEVELGETAIFTGNLTGDVPLGLRKLRVSIGGVARAYPVTDEDGNFTFEITFDEPGDHLVLIDYLAAGDEGSPPSDEWCTQENDTIMRTCLTIDPITGEVLKRSDVHTWICSGGKWVATGNVCRESYPVEPCVCYDGDNEQHHCAPGDDVSTTARFYCMHDVWEKTDAFCSPSESPPGVCAMCDTEWLECPDGIVVPTATCDYYGSMNSTGLSCMRPSGPPGLTVWEITPPEYSSYYGGLQHGKINRFGNLMTFAQRGPRKNWAHIVSSNGEAQVVGTPSRMDDILWGPLDAALMAEDEIYVYLSPLSYFLGASPTLRLIRQRVSTGEILSDYRFGDEGSRGAKMIRLSNGSLVGSWHQWWELVGSSTMGFFVVKPGETEPRVLYPVVVPTDDKGASASQRNTLVEGPDGDIWFFYHCDGHHQFGYVRLQETLDGLKVVSSYWNFISSKDSRGIGMWAEIPYIASASDPVEEKVHLFYAGMDTTCVRTDRGITSIHNGVLLELDGEGAIIGYDVTPKMVPYLHGYSILLRGPTIVHPRPEPNDYLRIFRTTRDSGGWDVNPERISDIPRLGGQASDGNACAMMFSDGKIRIFS